MFGIGGMEFVLILIVALVVLGPDHLPRVMRTLGKTVGDLRRASTEFQRTMNTEMAQHELSQAEDTAKITGTTKTTDTAHALPYAEPAATAETVVPSPPPSIRRTRKAPSPRIKRPKAPEPEPTPPPAPEVQRKAATGPARTAARRQATAARPLRRRGTPSNGENQ